MKNYFKIEFKNKIFLNLNYSLNFNRSLSCCGIFNNKYVYLVIYIPLDIEKITNTINLKKLIKSKIFFMISI